MPIQILFGWLLFLAPKTAESAHIIGGEITYECLGYTRNDPATNSRRYRFTMKIYRDCLAPGSNFDSTPGNFPASVTLYRGPQDTRPMVFYLPAPRVTRVQPDPGNSCVEVPQNVCVEQGIFTLETDLPIINESYILSYQRCCRNNTITNITSPERSGATYTIELTAEAQQSCNNSPVFRFFPPIVLCAGTPFTFDHSGTDAEGDSLVYELCGSLLGGGENALLPQSGNGVAPDPDLPPPYNLVNYLAPTYSATQPLGAGAAFRVDPRTGIMTGAPQQLGQFVVGICVSEYRNGRLLSRVLRDFQFNITRCEPNIVADIKEDSLSAGGLFLVQSCGNTSVTLINQSYKRELINSFRWEFDTPGGPLTSNAWDGQFNFPGPGTYTGRLILNPGTICSDSASVQVTIQPPVNTAFLVQGDSCRAGPFQFTDQSNTGGRPISSYSWNFGNNAPLVNQPNPTHQFAAAGSQTVRLRVTTIDGCSAETSATLRYHPLPEPFQIQASASQGCTPAIIQFSNPPFADAGSGVTLRWDFGDGGTAQLSNPVYTYRNAGTFPVTARLSAPNGCFREAALPGIRIETGVLADFSFSPEKPKGGSPVVEFTDRSVNAQSWSWDFGGEGQSSDPNPVFTFPPSGSYNIQLIAQASNGCRDTAVQTITIDPSLQAYWPNVFSPNGDGNNDTFGPLGGLFGVQEYQLAIYTRWGNLAFTTRDTSEGWNGRMQNTGQDLPQDVYFFRAVYKDENGKMQSTEGSVLLIR